DLRLFHDLRSAHHARLAARPVPVRRRGRARGALPRLFHADAPCPVRRAVPALAADPAHRQAVPRPAVRLEPLHARSPFMTANLARRPKTKRNMRTALLAFPLIALAAPAVAFCGFYVASADSKLFNKSSKVVLARDGQTTVITMASDYQGAPK